MTVNTPIPAPETANPPTTEALQEELDALRQEATIHALSVAEDED